MLVLLLPPMASIGGKQWAIRLMYAYRTLKMEMWVHMMGPPRELMSPDNHLYRVVAYSIPFGRPIPLRVLNCWEPLSAPG